MVTDDCEDDNDDKNIIIAIAIIVTMMMMMRGGWLAGARYLAVSELELAVLAVPGSCS